MTERATDRPDFLWDEPTTRSELKQLLSGEDEEARLYYAAKILREARFEEVWEYLSPTFLSTNWDKLHSRLGRKKRFWEFFYTTWRADGLIA